MWELDTHTGTTVPSGECPAALHDVASNAADTLGDSDRVRPLLCTHGRHTRRAHQPEREERSHHHHSTATP